MMSAENATSREFLRIKDIHKRYGGVRALNGVDLSLRAGEAYHLLGENGCGKSTIIKVMSGAIKPTSGTILFGDKTFGAVTPLQALDFGIETVYQDLSLLPNLTVEENIALTEQLVIGHGKLMRRLDRTGMEETAIQALNAVGLPSHRRFRKQPIAELPLAQRQLVAIARAIGAEAKLVIMDEPTTSLTRREVENLIRVVERLLKSGVAVLFVTHKLEECFRIGGNAIVFRDGQCVAQGPLEQYSRNDITRLMTGREIAEKRYRYDEAVGDVVLSAEGLSLEERYSDIDLILGKGQIIGITGLSDSGRNELAKSLAGILPVDSGLLTVDGEVRIFANAEDAIKAGVGYVPEDRLFEGLFLGKSILNNTNALILDSLTGILGFIDRGKARQAARDKSADMDLNTSDMALPVQSLSGGNQQRVLIGRWLSIAPKVLVLHGPTVGVDVGSKEKIYMAMQELARKGMAIIVVSDDLPELLQNCDEILVMNSGHIVDTLDAKIADEEAIYASMLATMPQREVA
jgi:simple sugar transport system ATP-binding protein